MRYPDEIHRKANDELTARRLTALNALGRNEEDIRRNHPEIEKLRRLSATLGVRMGRAAVINIWEDFENSKKEFEENAAAIRNALIKADLPADYLEPPFACKACKDKGFVTGEPCECRKKILNRLTYIKLADVSKVTECSFENFELSYYTDNRKDMAALLKACRRYAAGLSRTSPSLLFRGNTGLGKTHLSISIAREVIEGGKFVMYGSAARLIERITNSALGDKSEDGYRQLVYGCDLLVIDDLGTEFKTHITKSEVYGLINTRLAESRPTIISTNLTLREIEATYDPCVLSRLTGAYIPYQFNGSDIRFQKKERMQYEKSKETHK